MSTPRRNFLINLSVAAALPSLFVSRSYAASDYPGKPVRMVVPFPPGSVTDTVARGLGNELQHVFNTAFVTENRPGAQTTIGTNLVAQSDPDGYTLLVAALSFVSSPSEIKNLPFDPVQDFEPIALLGTFPIVLMVREDFPASTVEEFLTYARAQTTPLLGAYGSSSTRVAANRLSLLADIPITEVPYKGIPDAVVALMGGFVDFTFVDLGNALINARGGRVKALGVTSQERSPNAPDWPPLSDNIPDFEITAWLTVLAPANTDQVIIQRLNQEINKVLESPSMSQTLAAAAMTPPIIPLPELQMFISDEVDKWAQRYKDAGIEPQ